jgi:hypothetical protein
MMRKTLLAAIAAGGLMAFPVLAQEAAPEIRSFDIPTLEKLGHDMYVQDEAAWHATDALMAVHPAAEMQKEKVGGWIVEDRPDGELVRFIRNGDAGPEAAYDIVVGSGKPVVSTPSDRHLTDVEKAQFSARSLALKSVTQKCGDNYNTIVLKDPQGSGWLAWALAASTNPDLVMAGGHHRLTVSADGLKVERMDALSRTCAVMSKAAENGKRPVALMGTQLVSNLPVETFVFLSLQHHMPIVVMTPDRTAWGIINGKIAKMDLSKH